MTRLQLARSPLKRLSAGIVPVREGPAGVEFLLLYNLFFEQWQFPRGTVLKGESERTCALREFREETGLKVRGTARGLPHRAAVHLRYPRL